MPSMMRRMRTRLPTYLPTGWGAWTTLPTLLQSTPRVHSKRRWIMPEARPPSNHVANIGVGRNLSCDAPSDDEEPGCSKDDDDGNIARASINRRRDRRWQIRIQHPFQPEPKTRDKTSQRIDDRGDPGICGTNKRQSLFDGSHARLLEMLIGTT